MQYEVVFTFYKETMSMSYIVDAFDKKEAEEKARAMVVKECGGRQIKKCSVQRCKVGAV